MYKASYVWPWPANSRAWWSPETEFESTAYLVVSCCLSCLFCQGLFAKEVQVDGLFWCFGNYPVRKWSHLQHISIIFHHWILQNAWFFILDLTESVLATENISIFSFKFPLPSPSGAQPYKNAFLSFVSYLLSEVWSGAFRRSLGHRRAVTDSRMNSTFAIGQWLSVSPLRSLSDISITARCLQRPRLSSPNVTQCAFKRRDGWWIEGGGQPRWGGMKAALLFTKGPAERRRAIVL